MIRSQSFSKLVPLECELHMFLSLLFVFPSPLRCNRMVRVDWS